MSEGWICTRCGQSNATFPYLVGVVKDGTKTRSTYHMDFWTEDRKR